MKRRVKPDLKPIIRTGRMEYDMGKIESILRENDHRVLWERYNIPNEVGIRLRR